MAVTITSVGNATDFAVTSLPTGATITVATGDWLVAVLATASNLTVTFSDSGGNAWTNRVSVMDAAARAKIHFATAPITSAFSSGTVTATLSSASGQDALQVYRVRPGVGQTVSFVAADTTGVDGNLTLHAAATVSVASGNIIFGGASLETNDPVTGDSDTLNGSWSSIVSILYDGGSDLSAIVSSSQYKTVSATGNQSWSCSTTSARQGICSYLVLHVTGAAFSLAAAQGQYTLSGTAMTPKLGHAPIVAGAGSYALTGTDATPIAGGASRMVVADAGSYALTGTNSNTILTSVSTTYFLTGSSANLFKTAVGGKTLPAEAGSYGLFGADAATLQGRVIAALAGSYTLTGTDSTLRRGYRITAGEEIPGPVGNLYLETSDFLLLETADRLVLDDSGTDIIGGAYLLAGTAVNLINSANTIVAGVGSYSLTGTAAGVLHGWRVGAGDDVVLDLLDELGNPILDELGNPLQQEPMPGGGSYALTGTDVTLTTSVVAHLTIATEPGSYLLTGTEVALRSSALPPPSPLHIGEWPIDKRKRRAREDARAREQRARDRFRRAIARLLEGLPPEFDEPDLVEALDNAVQAANLLYALSAPIREINEVNELIDHIRQLRIAQPIAQLHLAQAYNQAHRHLAHKAQEDVTMALLLGPY